ncbi:MAG: DUF7405 family protein [Gaiellaceae bacterium]
MKLTRRQVLAGAAAGALGTAGAYELVDKLVGASPVRRAAGPLPPEQHVLDGVRTVTDNGVEVLVPPLHHEVLTARVKIGAADLAAAKRTLDDALAQLDGEFAPTPAGLGVTVAWGLPYFERLVPAQWRAHAPHDRRADKSVLLPARRFPSDPDTTLLEENDVAFLIRSDVLDHVAQGATAIAALDLFDFTSIRKGFAGGGFEGRTSLPKQMAVAAGVPGAELIPDTAELFLGFTSTQAQGLGPRRIVNFETLGYVDLRSGYFHEGTHMHLSHIAEQLDTWYQLFDFRSRVNTVFRPGLDVKPGTQTVRQAPADVSTAADVKRDYKRDDVIGHSAAIQTASRLQADHVAADGTVYAKGTAIPQRADFNTLDNPFFWSAHPSRDGMSDQPSAGVHFVVFNPTGDDFERMRLAMDGVLPDGTKLKFVVHDRGQGFNSVLFTTHRQNFLVPPRRHRSFPLAEL